MLFRNRFFDLQTRGVFIDLTTYNANMNELLLVRLIAEQSEFGGLVPSSSFYSIRVRRWKLMHGASVVNGCVRAFEWMRTCL